jgi:hypothetical protein
MKLTVVATGTYSFEWPIIQVQVNGVDYGTCEIQNTTHANFEIDLDQDQNVIEIHYVNKQQHHTVFDNGAIVQDQSLELKKILINDILLDNWFLTQGHYCPEYFQGFLQQCPDAAKIIRSEHFWFWYRDQSRYVHVKKFDDKGTYRNEGYIGSFDPLTSLVTDIQRYINV